jgi:hypothetical protein
MKEQNKVSISSKGWLRVDTQLFNLGEVNRIDLESEEFSDKDTPNEQKYLEVILYFKSPIEKQVNLVTLEADGILQDPNNWYVAFAGETGDAVRDALKNYFGFQ